MRKLFNVICLAVAIIGALVELIKIIPGTTNLISLGICTLAIIAFAEDLNKEKTLQK